MTKTNYTNEDIDVSDLQKGIYLIEIGNKDNKRTLKLIKN